MATWVLVLALGQSPSGISITNVPGYATNAECVAAGDQYAAAAFTLFQKYVCIPGPNKS